MVIVPVMKEKALGGGRKKTPDGGGQSGEGVRNLPGSEPHGCEDTEAHSLLAAVAGRLMARKKAGLLLRWGHGGGLPRDYLGLLF